MKYKKSEETNLRSNLIYLAEISPSRSMVKREKDEGDLAWEVGK